MIDEDADLRARYPYDFGICSRISCVASPKFQTSIAGGATRCDVRVVHIWLRWSFPCCSACASLYETGAHRWYPSSGSI